MDVYVLLPVTGSGGLTDAARPTIIPSSLRMGCQSIKDAAFCWDADGQPPPDYSLVTGLALVRTVGRQAIVRMTIDEARWYEILSGYDSSISPPSWGRSVQELINTQYQAREAIRQALITLGLSIPENSVDIIAWVQSWFDAWIPETIWEERSRSHYLIVLDETRDTQYPEWLASDGIAHVENAIAFLDAIPDNDLAPLRLACTLYQLANASMLLRYFE